jgi:signal transduction histidine kinase
VRAVVTAHGGEVRADPVPGGGLTITVTLPAAIP